MKKSNIIIGSLIFLIFVISITITTFYINYARNNSSESKNNCNVEIIDIVSIDKKGSAGNTSEPIYTKTSATFKAYLVQPGDSITYNVTVKNKDTLDVKVSKITLSDSNNPAIIFKTSGIEENDLLEAGEKQVFTVIVSYNEKVTSLPDTLYASLSVKLDYVQNK